MRLDVSTITGGWVARIGAELGDGHRGVREQLEQERLEVVVRTVDLVDQEDGRARARVLERPQERTAMR